MGSTVPAPRRWRRARIAGAMAAVGLIAAVAFLAKPWRSSSAARASAVIPTMAIGEIRDDSGDSARLGGLLADMLAADLARVPGLQVVASARIEDLMPRGRDTSPAGYWDAARRAGATELLEGRMLDQSADQFTVEMRRVDLGTGLLRGAYRVSAPTRFRLVDSVTAVIARSLRLAEPPPAIADITTRSTTAYRLYQEGLRAYYQLDYSMAHRMMRAALDDDSTFAMAAYYNALLTDSPQSQEPTSHAIRLAEQASDRERLVITTSLMSRVLGSPAAIAVADTLAARYPNDPRALQAIARVRQMVGDWAGAARAAGRAAVIDSAAFEARMPCYLCEDLDLLADVYFWWDSIPAAARVAQRYTRLQPEWSRPWEIATWAAAKMGDSARARDAMRRYTALHPNPRSAGFEARINILLDAYDEIEPGLRFLFESPKHDDYLDSRWWLLIALRNQGRLRDAERLNQTGSVPGLGVPQATPVLPETMNQGLLALESGDSRTAAGVFGRNRQAPLAGAIVPGLAARYHAWRSTLAGMALAATGDTAGVRALADTVEYWGRRSLYGRDRVAHHYLRGLVHAAAGRDDDAIRELRAAIYSPTLGFTRVNFELGRVLLRQGRAAEAVSVLAPALRGEVDASNLYVTRTELHELLAQAYDRASQPDSAARHYRTVVRAWANADPMFHARRAAARAWLARYGANQVGPADDR